LSEPPASEPVHARIWVNDGEPDDGVRVMDEIQARAESDLQNPTDGGLKEKLPLD
jgi:hypothetical protein